MHFDGGITPVFRCLKPGPDTAKKSRLVMRYNGRVDETQLALAGCWCTVTVPSV